MSKSQRLTGALRDSVVSSAVIAAFDKKFNDLNKQEHRLTEKVRDALLGKHKKAFDSLPDVFFDRVGGIHVNVEGKAIYLRFDKPCATPVNNRYTSGRYTVKQATLIKAIIAFVEHKEKLEDERRSFERDVRLLVNSVNTTKSLVEAWPKAIDHLPKQSVVAANAIVPMNLVHNLNKTIAAAQAVQ